MTGLEIFAIISALASAAGTGASMSAAAKARRDMNAEAVSQLLRQRNLQKQATPLFESSLARSKPAAQSEQQVGASQESRALYKALQGLAPLQGGTNRANATIEAETEAQAAMAGQGNQGFRNALANQWTNTDLGIIQQLSGAAAQNAPYMIQAAGNKSAGLASLGSLFSSLGQLGMVYGAMAAPGADTVPTSGGGFKYPFGRTTKPVPYRN